MGLFDFFKNKPELTEQTTDKKTVTASNNYKATLDEIQNSVFQFLKPMGFKKKGRTFNRHTEEGVYQVINFQMGQYEFGDKYVIPGFRENYYGKFTINMGVMVQELYNLEIGRKQKTFFQDYDCAIRERLPHLTMKKDFWWALDDNFSVAAKEIIDGLNEHGIPWLDKFETRKKICETWGNIEGSARRAKLDVALIVFHSDKEKGGQLIQDYFDNIETHQGHKDFVKELAKRLGVNLKIT